MLANFRMKPDRALAVSRYEALADSYDASCKYIDEIRAAAIHALQLTDGDVVFDIACGTGCWPIARTCVSSRLFIWAQVIWP